MYSTEEKLAQEKKRFIFSVEDEVRK